jgi:hypothetical protein
MPVLLDPDVSDLLDPEVIEADLLTVAESRA